jgi:predicted methyltransferase
VINRAGENIGFVNAAILGALKPGGVFIVLDHAAADDAAADVSSTLHRIKQSTVVEQVTAAGFEYVGEDMSMRNASDPKDKGVFDPSIRGTTDQFVLKFRKPS